MGKLRSLGVVIFVILASLSITAVHSRNDHCGGHSRSYLEKLKAQFREAQAALFPPNLDFRVGWPWRSSGGGDDGGVEKEVEEAICKSLENAKRTMEDSAKAVADQTLQNPNMMIMSSHQEEDDHHSEL